MIQRSGEHSGADASAGTVPGPDSAATLGESLDPLLTRAFGVSLVLHLVLLAFGPVPSSPAAAPPPMALEVILPPPPEPVVEPEPEPAPEPGPAPEPEPEPEREPDPEPELGPEPTPESKPPGVTETAEVTRVQPPDIPEPPTPSPEPAADVDPRAVADLMEATIAEAEEEARRFLELRYRMRVREAVRGALEPEHPELGIQSGDSGLPSFRLSFRVDRDGYLLDLSLRRAPGTPAVPDGMHRALLALSPLEPPPAEIDGALTFTFSIEFR